MCRMNPNGSTRGSRTDPELQAGYDVEYSEIGDRSGFKTSDQVQGQGVPPI